MGENRKYSDAMIKQTELAWQYLEKAKPFTTYVNLVPVKVEQIEEFEKTTGQIVPPDYRYWLTRYGSGLIEFTEGKLEIPSIYELTSDGRMYPALPGMCNDEMEITA